MKGENNHSGLNFLQNVGIFKRCIRLVHIREAVADFDFRRDSYKGQIKIKPNPCFQSKIVSF